MFYVQILPVPAGTFNRTKDSEMIAKVLISDGILTITTEAWRPTDTTKQVGVTGLSSRSNSEKFRAGFSTQTLYDSEGNEKIVKESAPDIPVDALRAVVRNMISNGEYGVIKAV